MPDSPTASDERNRPAQISIRRDSPDDTQLRQVIVKLDGQPVAELLYGNSASFPVAPGHHRLQVDNTWNWKNLDVDVAPGEHLRFVVVNRAGRFTWFLVGTLGAGPMYVSITQELQKTQAMQS